MPRQLIEDFSELESVITVAAHEQLQYLLPATAVIEPLKRKIVLAGEGASVEVVGGFVGHGEEVFEMNLDIVHAAPHTTSRTLFKAAVADKARFTLNGVIKIEKNAVGADASLTENALLLSPEASATTIPSLEIDTDDVAAKHAATAGPIDLEQRFYLQSRGLDAPAADALLVRSFLAPVMNRLPIQWQTTMSEQLQHV